MMAELEVKRGRSCDHWRDFARFPESLSHVIIDQHVGREDEANPSVVDCVYHGFSHIEQGSCDTLDKPWVRR